MTRSRSSIIVAVFALTVTVAVLVAALGNTSHSARGRIAATRAQSDQSRFASLTPATATVARRQNRVSPRILHHFAVFDGAHASQASPSLDPSALSSPLVQGHIAPNIADAQYVTTPSGMSMWVVPGAKGICEVNAESQPSGGPTTGFSCADTSNAMAEGLVGTDSVTPGDPSAETFFGVVPNGESSVTVTTAAGSKTGAVANNVFSVSIGDVPASSIKSVVVRSSSGAATALPGYAG
jgi:hypothetical protein